MIAEDLTDYDGLTRWIVKLRRNMVSGPTWDDEYKEAEWNRFVERFAHRNYRQLKRVVMKLKSSWTIRTPPKPNAPVRITRIDNSLTAMVASVSSLPLGTVMLPESLIGNYFVGKVLANQKGIRMSALLYRS